MGADEPPRAGSDTLIRNGRVITCDAAFSIADAIAIRDGRIRAVGREADLAPLVDAETRIIDAGGRAVIPGLIDGHAHLDREGLKPVFPSLAGCTSIAEILDRVAALVADAAPGDWVVTMPIGEPPYYFDVPDNLAEKRFPTRWELDEVSPDNPVYIRPIWGYWRHVLPLTSVANSLALAQAGLTPDSELPDCVTLETDARTGALNGIIHENTFVPIVELSHFSAMPRFGHEDRVAGLKRSMRAYNATGTTSVYEEHGCAQEVINAWRTVHAAGDATVRGTLVYSPSWHLTGPDGYAKALAGWRGWLGGRGDGDDWVRIEGLATDFGVSIENDFRARAWPYTGWAGFNYGYAVPREHMVDFLICCARNDIRVSTIYIDFLELFEAVDRVVPIRDKRWVIGHLNQATPDQIARIRDLGVVMSAHTNRYIFKAGHLIRDEIGAENENTIEPLRALREAGVKVALATDNVPTSLFYPIWQAVSRYNRYVDGPIAPEQALGREDALRAATNDGAYLTFDEEAKGSLEPGKLADLVVLSDDPLTCAEDEIKDISAEMTMVGGNIVYRAEDGP